jgi:hypothetical protein
MHSSCGCSTGPEIMCQDGNFEVYDDDETNQDTEATKGSNEWRQGAQH